MNRQEETTVSDMVIGMLIDSGFEGIARAAEVLMNEVMKIERSNFLRAAPHERESGTKGAGQRIQAQMLEYTAGKAQSLRPQGP